MFLQFSKIQRYLKKKKNCKYQKNEVDSNLTTDSLKFLNMWIGIRNRVHEAVRGHIINSESLFSKSLFIYLFFEKKASVTDRQRGREREREGGEAMIGTTLTPEAALESLAGLNAGEQQLTASLMKQITPSSIISLRLIAICEKLASYIRNGISNEAKEFLQHCLHLSRCPLLSCYYYTFFIIYLSLTIKILHGFFVILILLVLFIYFYFLRFFFFGSRILKLAVSNLCAIMT